MKKALFIFLILAVTYSFVRSNNSNYLFPYDSDYFQAAERIVFIGPKEAIISILPKEGLSLDIRLSYLRNRLLNSKSIRTLRFNDFYGVKDSIDIPIRIPGDISRFTYQIEYKQREESQWKATPTRIVKTPNKNPQDKIEIIFISDDHLSDDADMGEQGLKDPIVRDLRLSGDSVNLFLGELIKNSLYDPHGEIRSLKNSFCLANTIYQIHQKENPDLIMNLGDTGIGFGHKWTGLGLEDQHIATLDQIDQYEKIFRIAQRKIFSLLAPRIPIYWVLGNHDGESGFSRTRESAIKYRKKYFPQPDNGSLDENYYSIILGNTAREFIPVTSTQSERGKVLLVALDVMGYNYGSPLRPEDWTLGVEQKEWLKKVLDYDADWKFVLAHHVLGGWPTGSDEAEKSYAYGRGPLFLEQDYRDFCPNPNLVEQVGLTKLMLEKGVDAFIYGHDHIFHSKIIGINSKGKRMRSICAGSPKYVGEYGWYIGDYWKKYYGFCGRFGEYEENWTHDTKVDFWGPSGYTKLTITDNNAEVEYVRSAYHRYTNIPPPAQIGDCVQKIILD